jgi:hypothetical protein
MYCHNNNCTTRQSSKYIVLYDETDVKQLGVSPTRQQQRPTLLPEHERTVNLRLVYYSKHNWVDTMSVNVNSEPI